MKNDQHLQKILKTSYPLLPNGWWIKDFFRELYPCRINYKGRKHDMQSEIVDKKIKYCEKCKRTWEYTPQYMNMKEKILYNLVPSLGKSRETCLNCDKIHRKA